MSLRCKCCDWTPYQAKSEFSDSVYHQFPPTRLVKDSVSLDIYCDACYSEIEDVISEFNLEEDEDGPIE